jgi:hypothetical protein
MNTFRVILLLGYVLLFSNCSRRIPETPQSPKEERGEVHPEPSRIWKDADSLAFQPNCPGKILPISYRMLIADTVQIKNKLITEGDFPGVVNKDTLVIDIPLPDGTWEKFRITQVQVMAPVLAAKYPYIKTYSGNSMLYPADQVRLEINSGTVRIMILSTRGTILLESFCPDDHLRVISFYKKNMPEGTKENFERK